MSNPDENNTLQQRITFLEKQLQDKQAILLTLAKDLEEIQFEQRVVSKFTTRIKRLRESRWLPVLRFIKRLLLALKVCLSLGKQCLARKLSVKAFAYEIWLQLQPNPDAISYQRWIEKFDRLDATRRKTMQDELQMMAYQPTISIIMPTYNSNLSWLDQAIQSVQQQVYPHWELCIADDASTNPALKKYLQEKAQQDSRIKIVFRSENGHISAASNAAIDRATGTWITFLDHDDQLAEHALWTVVHYMQNNRHWKLIYSDEDKIDAQGVRKAPYFKPDWNEDLFYSHNLITHLAVYDASLVTEVGRLRSEYDGAQDYDLAIRIVDKINADDIGHIPAILYHWREHEDSTALADSNAKPYAMMAGERALNAYFSQRQWGFVERVEHGYRAHYFLPNPVPKVSIIIPTRNALHFVKKAIESIERNTLYPNYEIVLIDNGSDDPEALQYFQQLASENRINIVREDGPFNFSAINNKGAAQATGEVLCFFNNDIEVITPLWLNEMVSHACREGVGAVGAKLLYPDYRVQHAGIICGIGGWAGHAHKGFPAWHAGYAGRAELINNYSAVTGACMVVQKQHFFAVGGFDEVHLAVACNDVDVCLKLRAKGLRQVYTPYALLFHHESATRGYEDTPEKKNRYLQEVAVMQARWTDVFAHDPAYNPNLTLMHENFALSWPPRTATENRAHNSLSASKE